MRDAYRRSQEYLQTTRLEETSEERLRQAFRKQLLLVAGFSQDEVEKMDISSIDDEELQTIMRKRLLGEKTNDCTQKVHLRMTAFQRCFRNTARARGSFLLRSFAFFCLL